MRGVFTRRSLYIIRDLDLVVGGLVEEDNANVGRVVGAAGELDRLGRREIPRGARRGFGDRDGQRRGNEAQRRKNREEAHFGYCFG